LFHTKYSAGACGTFALPEMPSSRPPGWAWILASFLVVAAFQAWPLPLHLSTALTGDPGGDTGVYVWNLWAFRHELIEKGTNPFSTNLLFALERSTDLSLHNYTVANDLLALPLLPWLGLVASFNVIYLLNVALAGLGMYFLVREVHHNDGIGAGEAWLAGVLFACSPYLVSRSEGHFSLAAAAALPFFAFTFTRAWHHHNPRYAAAAGACLAWAGYSDPYYAIYCVMIALAIVALTDFSVRRASSAPPRRLLRVIDVLLVIAVLILIGIALSNSPAVSVAGIQVSTRSLYTPVLVVTLLATVRALVTWRPRVAWHPSLTLTEGLTIGAAAGVVGAVILAPQLWRIAERIGEGRMVHAGVLWRSSAFGLDLLSYFAPNPGHPALPTSLAEWLIVEFQSSIPWVATLVIASVAWGRAMTSPTRTWTTMALVFGVLALGPFLQVGGFNTLVPLPWAFLRYLPVIGEARMPSRMGVIVIMAVSVAFAGALSTLARKNPARRRFVVVLVGLLLTLELLPAPRTLYRADIPAVYDTIAADSSKGVVLDLPFGIRDGLVSLGYFSPGSEFHQTRHHKPLVGGYLSRVSEDTRQSYERSPFLNTLMRLSEPSAPMVTVPPETMQSAAEFLAQTGRLYVVIDRAHTRPELRAFAIEALHLELVRDEGGYELYLPAANRTGDGSEGQSGANLDLPWIEHVRGLAEKL
jgi:hypothetical protein